MQESDQAQRAIIEGQHLRDSGIFEIRARIVVPNKASVLDTAYSRLILKGLWHKHGYDGFGLAPIPMGEENTFSVEIQPDPDDNWDTIGFVRPRHLILEDQKVFGLWSLNNMDDAYVVREYGEKVLIRDQDFNFERHWQRVGTH